MFGIRSMIGRRLSAAAIAAVGIWASGAPVAAQEVTLSFHHLLPPQASAPTNVLVPWMESIEAASIPQVCQSLVATWKRAEFQIPFETARMDL